MEITELLQKRLSELLSITNTLSSQSSQDKDKVENLIKLIKATDPKSPEDKEDNIKRVSEIKKINALAYLKANEVGINIRIINEIYSIIKFLGIEPNMDAKDVEVLDFNLSHITPTFILDKGQVVFFEKEVEEKFFEQFNLADSRDEEYIDKVRKFRENG